MVLGIDGGGSRTTAVAVLEDGTAVDKITVGSINYYSNPMQTAQDNLRKIAEAFGKYTDCFEAVFIGHSALNERATDAETKRFVGDILSARRICMDSDLYIALEAMHTDGPCAVAICGTGSMAVARAADGRIVHRGGFGYLLGDEGSGYAVSMEAIRTAIRAAEGIVPPTMLTQAVLDFFGVADVYALIELFYEKTVSRKTTASFLPYVAQCAQQGDDTARRILVSQAEAFAQTVQALTHEDVPLGLWGGVFCHVPMFTEAFLKRMRAFGKTKGALLSFPPELGAVFAAWKKCGIPTDAARLARIKTTYRALEESKCLSE